MHAAADERAARGYDPSDVERWYAERTAKNRRARKLARAHGCGGLNDRSGPPLRLRKRLKLQPHCTPSLYKVPKTAAGSIRPCTSSPKQPHGRSELVQAHPKQPHANSSSYKLVPNSRTGHSILYKLVRPPVDLNELVQARSFPCGLERACTSSPGPARDLAPLVQAPRRRSGRAWSSARSPRAPCEVQGAAGL